MTLSSPAWDDLRATRWNPPGRATKGERRQTYQTALEQSEQMFYTAAQISTVAQPIIAFYGLSQAGRAIAAAATTVGNNDWRLVAHGIHAQNPGAARLTDVTVKTDDPGGSSSFVKISEILGSPTWTAPMPFTTLWDMLSPNIPASQSLGNDPRSRRSPLDIMPLGWGESHTLATATVGGLPAWLADEPDVKAAFEGYLSGYPGAAGYDGYVLSERSDEPKLTLCADGQLLAQVNWLMPGGRYCTEDERAEYLQNRARWSSGAYYLMPAAGAVGPLHPLMAWWSVLFALSMIARYQPAAWMKHLDLNTSAYAHPLEKVLAAALHDVPALVAHTIREVS